ATGARTSDAHRNLRPTGAAAYRAGCRAYPTGAALSSLAGLCGAPHNSDMQTRRVEVATELPLRPQDEVECRRCEVHCDKVVYPGACVERNCPFLYSYEEFGHRYIGCMQNVYEVEIDFDMLRRAEAGRSGFGAVKATGQSLPMC